jgi:hypothetical protein
MRRALAADQQAGAGGEVRQTFASRCEEEFTPEENFC